MPNAPTPLLKSPHIDTLDTIGLDLEKQKIADELTQQKQIQQKILGAFCTTYNAHKISNRAHAQETLNKLLKSGINGSHVKVAPDYPSATHMLSSVKDWREVLTTNEETTYQGVLPREYKALAGYSTLEEIHKLYGSPGLMHVHFAEGTHEDDPFYAYTTLPIQTEVITVQLDFNSDIPFKQWFAGKDVFSILQMGIKDTIVRCNWRPRILNKH